MLVLTRKMQESVVVGDANGIDEIVKVTVLSIIGGRVRLGFDVAGDVPVHRWEVWQRIRGRRETGLTPGVAPPDA
jgi:carbon storage regulator